MKVLTASRTSKRRWFVSNFPNCVGSIRPNLRRSEGLDGTYRTYIFWMFGTAKRALCLALALALLLTAPGIGPTQAAAQTAPTPIKVNTPVGGLNLGAAGVGALSLQNIRIQTSLPGFMGNISNGLVSPLSVPTPVVEPSVTASPSAASLVLPASVIAAPGAAPQRVPLLRPSGGGMQPVPFQAPAVLRERAMDASVSAPAASLVGPRGVPAAAQSGDVRTTDVGEVPVVEQGASSLQQLRGRPNTLGRRFEELKRLFSGRQDSEDLRSDARALGELSGAEAQGETASPSQAPVKAGGWLSKIPFLGRRVISLPDENAGLAFKVQAGKAAGTPAQLALESVEAAEAQLSPVSEAVGAEAQLSLPPSAIPNAANIQEAPKTDPAPAQEKKERSALGKVAWWFISSLLVAQVGIEALGAAMPTLVQKAFGDFTVVAQLAVFSSIAGIIGRQIGPVLVEKFGIRKTYLGSMLLRLASISALIGLLATGHITLPLMIGFYSVNALIFGVTITALNSIPPLLVGQKNSALERFWSIEHTLVEIIGIAGPIVTGIVVSSFGFMPALIAFPVAALASAMIVWKTLRLPPKSELKSERPQSRPGGVGAVFKGFFQKIGRGAKLVWRAPALRLSFIAYSLVMMLNPFLYQMMAPGYALALVGAANSELATSVSGWLTGLYSAGGLLGGLLMTMEGNRIAKGKESGQIDDAQEAQILRKSLLRWLLLGTGGLSLLATLALPLPTLGAMAALPAFLSWASSLTLPALALIPFGIAQVISTLKLQSFFQARVPRKEDMADAMGFLGSASLAITTLGLVGMKYLFKAAAGLTPFTYLSFMLIPIGIAYLYLRWRLGKLG
ncbi:MAG: MFS transporter [Elusimicrobia bacterium]|nr:MFS transporter [Elusimicrobiota bacterium]